MMFARTVSLAGCLFFGVACTSAVSPAPSSVDTPAADPVTPVTPAAPIDDPPAPPVADPAAQTPGVSFIVAPETLAIDVPGAPGGQSTSYTSSVDATTLEGGKPSMLLASTPGATSSDWAATTATHAVDDRITGRRYRMRAKIKTEGAAGGWFWWRIDGVSFYQLDNMAKPTDRRIKGTTSWTDVSLVMDVPTGATGFAFGSGLIGQGKVWVGGITFEEVGKDVPTTPHFGNEI